MSQINWVLEHKDYFNRKMNGYKDAESAIGPYLSTLPLIDRGVKIADLGCGNGMLLKFIVTFSGHNLVPWGNDVNDEAIDEAKRTVLPDYATNFSIGDIDDTNYIGEPFDLIIANPFHARTTPRVFTEKCMGKLTPAGKLIYRVHDDVLQTNGITSLSEVNELNDMGIKSSTGYGLVFGTLEK